MSKLTPESEERLAWLLEPENPSVRYWTLRDILERPEDSGPLAAQVPDNREETARSLEEHLAEVLKIYAASGQSADALRVKDRYGGR